MRPLVVITSFLLVLSGIYLGLSIPLAILHVGPNKTGTTSFQKAVFDYLKRELEQENYYSIPWKGEMANKEKKNTNLAEAIGYKRHEDFAIRFYAEYSKEIDFHRSKKHNIILSSESFSNPSVDYSMLFNLMKGFEIRVCIVHRSLLNVMLSMYYEKDKKISSFSNWRNVEYFLFESIKNTMEDRMVAEKNADRLLPFVKRKDLYIFDFYGMIQARERQELAIINTVFSNLSARFQESMRHFFERLKYSNVGGSLSVKDFIYVSAEFGRKFLNRTITNKCESYIKENFRKLSIDLPYRCISPSNLTSFKYESLRVDSSLREKYGDRIFYGNVSANQQQLDLIQLPSDEPLKSKLCSIDAESILDEKNVKYALATHHKNPNAVIKSILLINRIFVEAN